MRKSKTSEESISRRRERSTASKAAGSYVSWTLGNDH